jgi:hypothetical protein
MRTLRRACVVLVALIAHYPAAAHHSTANFDMKKSMTFTGTVKYFSFTSPHSFLDMDTVDKAGVVHHYKVFSVAKVVMLRTGWTSADVKVGDTVTMTTNPDRKDASYMYLQRITFANGRTWDRSRIF